MSIGSPFRVQKRGWEALSPISLRLLIHCQTTAKASGSSPTVLVRPPLTECTRMESRVTSLGKRLRASLILRKRAKELQPWRDCGCPWELWNKRWARNDTHQWSGCQFHVSFDGMGKLYLQSYIIISLLLLWHYFMHRRPWFAKKHKRDYLRHYSDFWEFDFGWGK